MKTKFSSNKRALSPAIASIIMITITVTVSVVVASWMGSIAINLMSFEEFKITDCEWAEDLSYADLTITNQGTHWIVLSNIRINGVQPDHMAFYSGSSKVDPGDTAVVRVFQDFDTSTRYQFRVLTARGNEANYVELTGSTSGASLYYINAISNVDSSSDKGTHSDFVNQQNGPDSVFDVLTEGDCGAGLTNIIQYVDNSSSDIDSKEDDGIETNFVNSQDYGPDSDFMTIQEENVEVFVNSTLLDDGFENYFWDTNWNDIYSAWNDDNYPVHSGSTSAWASDGHEGYFTSDDLDASDASAIYVDFWYRLDDTEDADFRLYFYDGSNYDTIEPYLGAGSQDTWRHYTYTITDPQYFKSNFRLRFQANLYSTYFEDENVWVDDVVITKEVQGNTNYELDLEYQWTSADFDEADEQVCIYVQTASQGGENLVAYEWNGANWQTLGTLSSDGWNNFTASCLTGSTYTINIRDEVKSNDLSQSAWNIDCIITDCNSTDVNYELDIEVQFTGINVGRGYDEICIYVGSVSGEDLDVYIWNGGSWDMLVTDLVQNQWNNVTRSITEETVTLRFLGGLETNDLVQDTWEIDCTMLCAPAK